jgi:hypothetical protein
VHSKQLTRGAWQSKEQLFITGDQNTVSIPINPVELKVLLRQLRKYAGNFCHETLILDGLSCIQGKSSDFDRVFSPLSVKKRLDGNHGRTGIHFGYGTKRCFRFLSGDVSQRFLVRCFIHNVC